METIITILKYLHIAAGSIALLAGPIAMANQNGGKTHRISGNAYLFSMFFIVLSSIILSVYSGKWFLFMVGIFSLYLVGTGYRALYLKNLHKGQKPYLIDWILLYGSGITAIALLIWGGTSLYYQNSFGVVSITFGFVMLRGVRSDFKRFTVPPTEKNHWLFSHISGMIGGYIATITAFTVQNIEMNPSWVPWLAPTAILVPFLVMTIKKFKNKSEKAKSLTLTMNVNHES
jgi:hypothetical protein